MIQLLMIQQPRSPHKLNWTKILYDHNIFIDSQAYRKWDGQLDFAGKELLEKDLIRTRSNQPYFQKQSTQEVLRRLVTFYCKNNKVSYQQGLLQVVIPFALLHRKDFQLRKCYAYFNAFMKKNFPKVLTQRIIQQKKQLPHAILAISLTQTLLRYHYPEIHTLFADYEVPLSMIITQEILTVFAKNTSLQYVYKIYDYYINKQNKNAILYMSVALIGQKEKQIKQAALVDKLHIYANKNIKDIKSMETLEKWFQLSQKIQKSTPKSFQDFSRNLGFTNHSVLTKEDLSAMMSVQQVLNRQNFIMPIYTKQILLTPDNYIIASIQGKNLGKSPTIKIKQSKSLQQYNINPQKIIVLAEIENNDNEQQQRQRLLSFAKQIKRNKLVFLQEKLPNNNLCIIY